MIVRRRFGIAIATGVLVLAGCAAVGPAPAIPVVTWPARLPSAADATADAEADLREWWRTARDPVLDRLVERALAANADLDAVAQRVASVRATVLGARAAMLPSATARGSATTERLSPVGKIQFPGSPRFDVWDAGLDAVWEIDLFGGRRRSVEAARADAVAAQADAAALSLTVTAEVVRTYAALRAVQVRLALARESAWMQRDAVALQTARARAGLVAADAVAAAESVAASLDASVPPLEVREVEVRNALATLAGSAPGALGVELDRRPDAALPAVPDLPTTGVPAVLLRRRPDVVRAERRVVAAGARIGQQLAEYYPRISLTGAFGAQARDLSDLATSRAAQWSFGPSVSWRVLDFARIDAAVAAARANERAAVADWRGSVLSALEEIDTSIARRRGVAIERDARDRAARAEADVAGLAAQRWRAGITDALPVLEARRRANDAADGLVRAQEAELLAAVQLAKALGGGWSVDPQPGPAPQTALQLR